MDNALNYNVYLLWCPILNPKICGFLPCPLQLTNCLFSSEPLRAAHEGDSIFMWYLVKNKNRYDLKLIQEELRLKAADLGIETLRQVMSWQQRIVMKQESYW